MNFRTLDLNLLRIFDAVMVERNATRAAESMAMTQPAVSNALRRLREALDEDLFVPGPTGMTPTAYAETLWPAVREALGGLREAIEPQAFDPQRDQRRFTLAMADATAAVLVPPFIDARRAEGWQAALSVEPLTTRDPRALLERGVADGAIGFFPDVTRELAAAAGASEIVLEPMYHCEYVLVMRRDHPLAKKASITLDDYCHADHARVSFAGRTHGFVDEALARLGRTRRIVLVINHFATAAHTVRQSELLAVFPRSYLPASGLSEELAVRPLPLDMPRIDVSLMWHRRHERDPGHRWLRETAAAWRPLAAAPQKLCNDSDARVENAGAPSTRWTQHAVAANLEGATP